MLSEGVVNFAVRQRPQSSSERGESSVFFSMASHDPSHSFTKSSQDDAETLFVLFDNDYGLGSDDAEIFELPDIKKRTLLLRLGLEPPVR